MIFVVGMAAASECLKHLTDAFLPVLVALVAVKIAMGRLGACRALVVAYAAFAPCLDSSHLASSHSPAVTGDCTGWYRLLPWSITAFWSSIAAWFLIAIYLALYALFLQPYLGDAARYFRNSPANVAVRREIRKEAVDALEDLHLSGRYDRIVVVAHSLGTVIAYDMLRAYYSRVDKYFPNPETLEPDLEMVDRADPPEPRGGAQEGAGDNFQNSEHRRERSERWHAVSI